MIRLLAAFSLALAPLAAAASTSTPPGTVASGPDTLADSTIVERWTLGNGLRVTTRHIPDARGVAVTVGYPFGSDQDPEGREGLAQLLGQLVFTSAAGEFPERTREELDSQRPYGWSYPVTRRSTLLTEVASIDQFPGVLREFAARLGGITVGSQALREAIQDVRRERTAQVGGAPEPSLAFRVREVALERSDQEIARRAATKGLERISLREVQEHLSRRFVPSNATLSLAGRLDEVDIHRLVHNLFGDIPPGTAQPPAPPVVLKPGTRVTRRTDLSQSAGVVGLISPAIDDSLHPAFLLATLVIGNQFNSTWQKPGGPRTYQYSLLDDPNLVLLYPGVAPDEVNPEALSGAMAAALEQVRMLMVNPQVLKQLCAPLTWLMGGPMGPDKRLRITTDPTPLHTLARSMAACSMWGGAEFWTRYRQRLEQLPLAGLQGWLAYYQSPDHQVRLLLIREK